MNKSQLNSIIIRYSALLILGILSIKLNLFYRIFTPLTVYPVYFIIKLIHPLVQLLNNNILSFNGFQAQIVSACVAGSAYFLLLILNLSTSMDKKTRLKSITFLIIVFLVLNVSRIIIFSSLLFINFKYFNFTHLFFWYFGSTLLVVLIWFLNVKLFKIKNIPAYTDFKLIFKDIK